VAVDVANGTSALYGKTVIAIAARAYGNLVLCSDGTLAAWGINGTGELGNNSRINSKVPVAVNAANGISALFGKTVVAIAAGGFHNLALCSDGTLVAWGNNVEGALGDNSTTDRLVPVAVNVASGTSATVRQVSHRDRSRARSQCGPVLGWHPCYLGVERQRRAGRQQHDESLGACVGKRGQWHQCPL